MNTLLLAIIGIPAIEIYLFIKVGSQIGAFNTILLIFITAFFGVFYSCYEGFNTLKYGMSQMVSNEFSSAPEASERRSVNTGNGRFDRNRMDHAQRNGGAGS